MYNGGFVVDEKILNNEVPASFIEAKGIFKDYLREYYTKDGFALIHLNRKGDKGQEYDPSEVEIALWINYFGQHNFVRYYNEINNYKIQENETDNIDI